jgi:hypothetical protein
MQQLYRLLIFLIQPYVFRATNSQPTGATVEMERSSISTLAPFGSSVGALYQKLYIHSKSAPEDGRICRPKHVGLI